MKIREAILALVLASLILVFPLSLPVGAVSTFSPDTWALQNAQPEANHLHGIWGSSSTDVFAVGSSGTILHYDGTSWTSMSNATTERLWSVWGSSSTDVLAVGDSGTILHYDGTSWSSMSSGTTTSLLGVWGSSSTDVFAVGSSGTILHYNGTSWIPMSSGTTSTLHDVWGVSSSDVFAVGASGTILHYNGASWNSMSSGTTSTLHGVWGTSSSDVFVVGSEITILRYDGASWSSMSRGTFFWLYRVWGSSPTDVFTVGQSGTIRHYDGSVWSPMDSGILPGVWDVWGSSSSDVFGVGNLGVIIHYDGTSWNVIVGSTSEAHRATSVSPSSGTQGETLDVTIAGINLVGTTRVSLGEGITVNSFTVDSSTQISANITIDQAAAAELRNVSVTTPERTSTLAGGFEVTQKEDEGDNGGLFDCSCSSEETRTSTAGLLAGCATVGLCWATGYYLVRKISKQTRK